MEKELSVCHESSSKQSEFLSTFGWMSSSLPSNRSKDSDNSFVEFKSQAIDLGKIENDYEEFILFEIPHSPKLTFNKRSKPNLNNISTFILE